MTAVLTLVGRVRMSVRVLRPVGVPNNMGPMRVGVSTVVMPVGVRMPPEHQLLNDEEDGQSDQQHHTDLMCAVRSNTLDGFRQQREQSSAQQRARGIADEMRHEPTAGRLGHQKKQARERRAGNTADGGEENNPGEQRHGFARLLKG